MSEPEPEDLLVEIGTEELPPGALSSLSEAFRDQLAAQLDAHRIDHGDARAFATPRRLAVLVDAVAPTQRDDVQSRRGPALAAAFNVAGEPTKAALGFARSCGVPVEALEREETDKGSWLSYRHRRAGQDTGTLLPGLIEAALAALPIPKRMRWGVGEAEFVRPVHWVCVLLGSEPLPGRVLGVEIRGDSRGHRFHHPEAVPIEHPSRYGDALRHAWVDVDFGARRASIRGQVEQLARKAGGTALIPDALLDEVTALCEWPAALLGSFDEDFLVVPPEVLIETMQKNQKYFPVLDQQGRLVARFIAVSNIESRQPDLVRAGNERVIRPRFADAKFFWEQDLKHPLAARLDALDTIVFQHKLGTLRAKSERIAALARHIARLLGDDPALAERAGLLAKCDLTTLMVGEFPSLQGVMGRYYAAHAGEDACVVHAMDQHYLPRHANDRLPADPCGRAVALADRLDSLIGIFAIGQRPTGVKDPYGLRRAAIAVLRILIETPLTLDLHALLRRAADEYRGAIDTDDSVDAVFAYAMERINGYFGERGSAGDSVAAVLAVGSTIPSDIARRIAAVEAFRALPEAASLAAANKRIRNILRKAAPEDVGASVMPEQLQQQSERELAGAMQQARQAIAPLAAIDDYSGIMQTLAGLRPQVDHFFDDVMVMTDEIELRRNRLALLMELEGLFTGVADISLLHQTGGDA